MPLATGVAYHAGPGSLGGYPGVNPNAISLGVEIEGPQFPGPLLAISARVTAALIQFCRDAGSDPFLIGHKHIQDDKSDPAFNWNDFVKVVYSNLPMFKATRVQ